MALLTPPDTTIHIFNMELGLTKAFPTLFIRVNYDAMAHKYIVWAKRWDADPLTIGTWFHADLQGFPAEEDIAKLALLS